MGICHLSLITKPLDKLCVVHSFKRTPLPLPPSLIFMASLPRYQKTYLLCTINLEYSATVKKTQNFPVFYKVTENRHLGRFCTELFNLLYIYLRWCVSGGGVSWTVKLNPETLPNFSHILCLKNWKLTICVGTSIDTLVLCTFSALRFFLQNYFKMVPK